MRIALCNEVVRELEFSHQCTFAAAVGYDALEIAPFTLADEPHRLSAAQRSEVRNALTTAGLEMLSLHWLLLAPKGLSITSADATVRNRTVDVMRRLVELCADLGGQVLVHGSPAQRKLEPGAEEDGRLRAAECLAAAAESAAAAGVTYCIEPLAPRETNFVNTVAEAVAIVEHIGNDALKTMIDCSAAGAAESEPVSAVIRKWVPSGMIRHVQVNDPNRRGPGEGELEFVSILAALRDSGYSGDIAVEPFVYAPDGRACAARCIGYLRGCLEGVAT